MVWSWGGEPTKKKDSAREAEKATLRETERDRDKSDTEKEKE